MRSQPLTSHSTPRPLLLFTNPFIHATRNLLSWLNPPAARGPHLGEAVATAAERRAVSQPPSPHHRQTTMESSNADGSAAPCSTKLPTTRPPSRLQLGKVTSRPYEQRFAQAPDARMLRMLFGSSLFINTRLRGNTRFRFGLNPSADNASQSEPV